MRTSASEVSVADILPWREHYRQEMNCQIIHDSLHARSGWTKSYRLAIDQQPVGYGAVAVGGPWRGRPTVFECFVARSARVRLFELFAALLDRSGAVRIDAQSNDPILSPLTHIFARAVRVEKLLFRDEQTTSARLPEATFRAAQPADAPRLAAAELDPDAGWLVEIGGAIVAAGGVLCHYNRPYGDIYMKVAGAHRRRGIGAFVVQELKRICRETGSVPAARCDPANTASRRTLEKAGFAVCGVLLNGEIDAQRRSSVV